MMARLRFLAVALLALALAGNSTQLGRSASDPVLNSGSPASGSYTAAAKPATSGDGPCTIYALADMGYDSGLGEWIAQTIPEMIEPSSWQQQGGRGLLRYYAPKNILIIRHSAAIQAKVDGFLKDLKKSLPKESERSSATGKKTPRAGIVPAAYQAPALLRTSGPVPEASSYPVPAPVKPPKHLFHFLIRYEGDGIIDDNVVKFMKTYSQAEQGAAAASKGSYAGGSGDPLAAPPSVSIVPASPAAGAAEEVKDPKTKEDKKDKEKGNSSKEPTTVR